MLNSNHFLAVDFGAGSLKLAAFEVDEAGTLRLTSFAIKPLGAEGAQEARREAAILKALQEVIAEKGLKARSVNVSAPGFHVFSKFVKLPPVDATKVTQIIQYEAQQNVPFPLAEVVWDYQILGATATGELEVLLVAIKADVVEGLFRATDTAGLSLQLTDVSPAALCNAFRYNYGDLEDCSMLLDIGAKTSNLLFFEKGKVYARSINLGANSITQDFAAEAKLPFAKAEQIKMDEGFVSLGGAYEEPENPHQAAISKIARQFMTRLHIQVNQTLQFYRGQQGGAAPQRLFLAGGASVMPYTAQFFAEKLNVPVEYFNPLRNVQIDPAVSLEELAKVAHSMGEVVGLGLRNLANCPVELNLMPESTLRWQSLNQKKPYLFGAVFSLVLVVFAVGWLFSQLAAYKEQEITDLRVRVEPLQQRDQQFRRAYSQFQAATNELGMLKQWMQDRFYWAETLAELRLALARVEAGMRQRLGADTGVWIERMVAMETLAGGTDPLAGGLFPRVTPGMVPGAPSELGGGPPPGVSPRVWAMTSMPGGFAGPPPVMEPGPPPVDPGMAQAQFQIDPNTGQPMIDPNTGQPIPVVAASPSGRITLICRGVDMSRVDSSANAAIAYALEAELRQSPLFSTNTALSSPITDDPATSTFSFTVSLEMNRPLNP